MKYILLTKNKKTLVDDEDYEWLNQWKWYAVKGDKTFYAGRTVRCNGKKMKILMHRLILGAKKGQEVDHKEGDGLDNRRSKIRLATRIENGRNIGLRKHSTSGFIGVTWNKEREKWEAKIRANGKRMTLGRFADKMEAVRVRDAAARELHGAFAKLND